MTPFWTQIDEATLAQGDLFRECLIPVFSFRPDGAWDDERAEVPVSKADMIIVTQSCDLAQEKVSLVALCPIHSLSDFEKTNTDYREKGKREQVRKGRVEGLHLLASPTHPEQNREALVVDFGQIFSLPFEYLTDKAKATRDRWRLAPPFLEHFSQAFARFFMRVGLPSSIPRFR